MINMPYNNIISYYPQSFGKFSQFFYNRFYTNNGLYFAISLFPAVIVNSGSECDIRLRWRDLLKQLIGSPSVGTPLSLSALVFPFMLEICWCRLDIVLIVLFIQYTCYYTKCVVLLNTVLCTIRYFINF